MAQLIYPDIGGSYRDGLAFGTQQRQLREGEERRSALSNLAAEAYGAAPPDRTSILSRMAALSPEAAQQQNEQFESGDDRRNKQLVNMAKLLTAAPDAYKDSVYQRMRPALGQLGLQQVPDAYSPEVGEMASRLVQAWSPNAAQEQFTLAPGAARYDAQGRLMVQQPFAPAKPQFERDMQGQGWWLEPGKAPVPVNQPGSAGAPTPRGPESGAPFTIDPSLPQHVQDAIRSNELAWSQAPDGAAVELPARDVAPGAGAAAAPASSGPVFAPSGGVRDTFAPLTSDEIQQAGLPPGTVAQRNLTTGQVAIISRPVAPAGFRFKTDGTLEPIPGGPKPAGAAATEDERKAAGWVNQARNAFANMERALHDDPQANEPGFLETYIPVDEIANRTRSDARQRYVNGASSFSEAALRAATGAGVNKEEAEQKIRELTPQRGDTAGVREQKRAAMEVYLKSLEQRAGRALQPSDSSRAAAAGPARPTTDADFAALPSGAIYIDPDDGRTYRKP